MTNRRVAVFPVKEVVTGGYADVLEEEKVEVACACVAFAVYFNNRHIMSTTMSTIKCRTAGGSSHR